MIPYKCEILILQFFITTKFFWPYACGLMAKTREVSATERIPSCVRGHHIYKQIWTLTVGEVLCCACEHGNVSDRYTVSVLKDNKIVGHLPRKLSRVCAFFIGRGGSISCEISGTRRYSRDLQQGDLRFPIF